MSVRGPRMTPWPGDTLMSRNELNCVTTVLLLVANKCHGCTCITHMMKTDDPGCKWSCFHNLTGYCVDYKVTVIWMIISCCSEWHGWWVVSEEYIKLYKICADVQRPSARQAREDSGALRHSHCWNKRNWIWPIAINHPSMNSIMRGKLHPL